MIPVPSPKISPPLPAGILQIPDHVQHAARDALPAGQPQHPNPADAADGGLGARGAAPSTVLLQRVLPRALRGHRFGQHPKCLQGTRRRVEMLLPAPQTPQGGFHRAKNPKQGQVEACSVQISLTDSSTRFSCVLFFPLLCKKRISSVL